MVALGGGLFLMSEVPLFGSYTQHRSARHFGANTQGAFWGILGGSGVFLWSRCPCNRDAFVYKDVTTGAPRPEESMNEVSL